jgi:hypothetical protein
LARIFGSFERDSGKKYHIKQNATVRPKASCESTSRLKLAVSYQILDDNARRLSTLKKIFGNAINSAVEARLLLGAVLRTSHRCHKLAIASDQM